MSIIGGSLCGHRPLTTKSLGGRNSSREPDSAPGSSKLPIGSSNRGARSPVGGGRATASQLRPPPGSPGPTGSPPAWQLPSPGSPGSSAAPSFAPPPGSPLPGSPSRNSRSSGAPPPQTREPSWAPPSPQKDSNRSSTSQSKRRSLTADLPDPESIQKQKAGHSQTIESQLRDGADTLGASHKQKTDYLHALANQQKHQFNLMLDAQVKAQEKELTQQYQNDLVRLQQAAQQRRAQLECQAAALTLEWQQKKTAEEFLRQNDGIEQQYSQAQEQIEKAIEKFGRDPTSLAIASAKMMPTVVPNPGGPTKKASSFGGSPVATYSTPLAHMTSSSLRVPGPASRMQYIPPSPATLTLQSSWTPMPRSSSRSATPARSPSRPATFVPTPRIASPQTSFVPPEGIPMQQIMHPGSPKKLSYVPPGGASTVTTVSSPTSSYVPVIRQTSGKARSPSPGPRLSLSSSRSTTVLSPPFPNSVTVTPGPLHRAVAANPGSISAPSRPVRSSSPAPGIASPTFPTAIPLEAVKPDEGVLMYAPPPNLSGPANRRLEYVPPVEIEVNGG
mmetsp:Transcript_64377/g.121960  ORF Transcript_64377/g.121960 Transcript_64377/m.121960 type:complete len:559 (-) Transcript_64377:196-1872(-)